MAFVPIFLLATNSLVTRQNFLGWTISAEVTLVLGVFLPALWVLDIIVTKNIPPEPWRRFLAFVLLLWFLYFAVSCLFSPSIPAAQNLAILSCFVFGLLYWARLDAFWVDALLKAASFATLFSASVFIFEMGMGWAFVDNRSFAMTAVVGLAVSVAVRSTNVLLRLSPFVIFIAILLSASRTATLAALLIVGLAGLRRQGPFKVALARTLVIYFTAILVTVVAYTNIPANVQRLEAGDSAVSLPVPEVIGGPSKTGEVEQQLTPTITINSNGRITAWGTLLKTLDSPIKIIFGNGTGSAAKYGREHLVYFDQPLNEYLRFFVDGGVIGAILSFSGVSLVLFFICRRSQADAVTKLAAIACFVVVAVMSATDGQLSYPFTVIPAALILGMALGKPQSDLKAEISFKRGLACSSSDNK